MNSQNVTIAMLLVTAAILTAVLIGTFAGTGQVARAEASVSAGDYTMTTGVMSGSNVRLLYVINMDMQKLNVYRVDHKTGAIAIKDQVDLARAFKGK